MIVESKEYRNNTIDTIKGENFSTLSILNYVDSCSYEAAERLRADTWGEPMVGATAPFVAEQVKLQSCASPLEVSGSIVFTVDEDIVPPTLQRGEKRGFTLDHH